MSKVIVIVNHKSHAEKTLKNIAQAYCLKFEKLIAQADEVEILTKLPSPNDVKDCVLIGNLVPTYIAEKAEFVCEANCMEAFNIPSRFAEQMEAEEFIPMLKFPRAYKVESIFVEDFVADGIEA